MKKLYTFISILIISFSCFIYILYKPKDYVVNYKIDNYNVKEIYVKSLEKYKVFINYNDRVYPLIIDSEFKRNRKIINNIDVYENEKDSCLIINSNDIVCYKDDILVDYHLVDKYKTDYNNEVIEEYNLNKIYNLLNKKIFIWNYKGFDYLSENNNKEIEIVTKDEYDNLLTYQDDNYLIIPNYDQEYYFSELYILNKDTLSVSKIYLDYDISYTFSFLGRYKNDIYLVDHKNKIQYKINIDKKKMNISGTESKGAYYYDGSSLVKISMNKLINDNLTFRKNKKFTYKIINNTLYQIIDDYKIYITDGVIDIISTNNDEVYYLKKNILYYYSIKHGEVKMLENYEWNFNYKSKIFIYD